MGLQQKRATPKTEILHDSFEAYKREDYDIPDTSLPKGIRTVFFRIGEDYKGIPLDKRVSEIQIFSRVGYQEIDERHEAVLYDRAGRQVGAIHYTDGIPQTYVFDSFGISPIPLIPEIIAERRAEELRKRESAINSSPQIGSSPQNVKRSGERRLYLVK